MSTGSEAPSSLGSRLADLWTGVFSRPTPVNRSELWNEHLRIRQELEQLKLATSYKGWKETACQADRIARLDFFLDWVDSVGVQRHSALEITSSEYGLCLSTTAPVEDGCVGACVPLSAIFSADAAETIESLKNILDNDNLLRTMDNVGLAIAVAHEVLRGSESEWAPYLNILPATFTTPIFYTEEQFEALKPSPVFERALGMYRAVSRQFVYFYLRILSECGEKAKKHLTTSSAQSARVFAGSPFSPHNFTFDLYRWCVSIVSTRINIVPSRYKRTESGAPKMIPALIPFIDLANHAHLWAKPASVFYEPEASSVKMQLNKNLDKGQELYIHYGPRSNSEFLLHNGFVPELPNPDDAYELKIGMPRSTTRYEDKLQCLAHQYNILPISNQSQQNTVFFFKLEREPGVETMKESSLWIFANIFVASDDMKNMEEIGSSEENSLKARKFLLDRLELLTLTYKNSRPANTDGETAGSPDIRRLKESEVLILNAHIECLKKMT